MSDTPQRRARVLRVLLMLAALALLTSVCTSAEPLSMTRRVVKPAIGPDSTRLAPDALSSTNAESTLLPAEQVRGFGLPDTDAARELEPARLGTYAVAKPGAGIRASGDWTTLHWPVLPVFDEPDGLPRTLLDVNAIDGLTWPVQLTNYSGPAGALVLRVIAGGEEDDWLLVQVPVRPNNSYAWVRADDFDLGYTSRRIEIDLTGPGDLTLLDGEEVLFETAIVHGREDRETPTHLGFIENGITPGNRLSPAYGFAIVSMASFSERLGTFGGGGLPSNFVHGTNAPELMGQRVSSGEIRVPDEALAQLVDLITPGAPVVLFRGDTRDFELAKPATPAATMAFDPTAETARDGTTGLIPQLWRRCSPADQVAKDQLLCRTGDAVPVLPVGSATEHVFAVAQTSTTGCFKDADRDLETGGPLEPQECLIPVFDEPYSSDPRTLVYQNDVDGVTLDAPLFAETPFGQPLVLSVLAMTLDAQWLRVRAPVLPHGQAVWVQRKFYEVHTSAVTIEVDLGHIRAGQARGLLWVYDGDSELVNAEISAGRETRPTTPTSTYVDQIIDGTTLSPAYGPWLFSTASFSEALGTFGGGGLPTQAIHAVQDEIWLEHSAMPASSGSIHTAEDTARSLAQIEDLLGARVIIYDSSDAATSRSTVVGAGIRPARTVPLDEGPWVPLVSSFT